MKIKFIFRRTVTAFKIIIHFFLYPLVILLLLIILCLRPFILIRIGFTKSKWVGEFLTRTEIYLQEKKKLKSKTIDFFINDTVVSNTLVNYKIKNKITVLPKFFFYDLYITILRLSMKNNFIYEHIPIIGLLEKNFKKSKFNYIFREHIPMRDEQGKDFSCSINKDNIILDITEDEIKKGDDVINNVIKKKFKGIVLLCIRDHSYNKNFAQNHDWSHLSYRNYDLKNFIPAAEYLANKGYLVLRMGKYSEYFFKNDHENIIDYCNSEFRSDFMDYYLGYKCDFCISTHTGMDCFARHFQKPFGAIVNPLEDIHFFDKNFTHIFGHFKNEITKKKLTINEIFENKMNLLSKIQETSKKKKTRYCT